MGLTMGTRLRKAFRIGGWSIGGLLMMAIAFAGLLAFPGFMFAHQLEYRNFTVHSDEELRGRIEPILAGVESQLSASEINAPSLEYDLFFGHDNSAFRALDRARWAIVTLTGGMGPSPSYATGWPPHFNHIVTFDALDPEHDSLLRQGWRARLNMTHILTHEAGHLLVFNRLGLNRGMALPLWKAEGYPEYIAAHTIRMAPEYSLRSSVTRVLTANLAGLRDENGNFQSLHHGHLGRSFLRDENGDSWHTSYYLARVLVEYSLDFKGMSFDQLADPGVSESDVLRELLADYAAGKL
jgi:hypothetical protein